MPILRTVSQSFPEFRNIYSFIDVFTGINKTEKNFSHLRKMGVRRVYLGVESGNPELLTLLRKPQPAAKVIELSKRIKGGGIALALIFLGGAGGKTFHPRHLRDSIGLIEQIPLTDNDLVYVSEFYETNPEYGSVLRNHGIPSPNRVETRRMAKEFVSAARRVVPKGVQVPIYDIQQFFY